MSELHTRPSLWSDVDGDRLPVELHKASGVRAERSSQSKLGICEETSAPKRKDEESGDALGIKKETRKRPRAGHTRFFG